jgi:hypothetical protein
MHSLDPTHEEPELEAQVEQAKEANPEPEPEPEQGKPQCITPPSLTFILNCYLYVKIECALGL